MLINKETTRKLSEIRSDRSFKTNTRRHRQCEKSEFRSDVRANPTRNGGEHFAESELRSKKPPAETHGKERHYSSRRSE